VAGFSGGEAEELRRALGFKRSQTRMDEVAGKLRRGMAALGITGTAAEEIVLSITSFALYGFPESHAASFALLVYASAYFKVHFPEEFYACMLNHQPMGFYHPATLVKDAQRRGVRILPVSVHHSDWDCRVVELPGPDPRGRIRAVRLGLRYAAGLRREAAESVVTARRSGGRFASVDDLAERTRLNRAEARRLAEIGALWDLGAPRRAALWQVEACWCDSGELFAGTRSRDADAVAPLPAMDAEDRMRADYCGTGLTLGPHPMALRREALRKLGVVSAAGLQQIPNGRRVRTAGVVIARQRPVTARGVLFFSLEDETGIGNLIIASELFERERAVCVTAPLLLVEGILQRQGKVVHVRVERLQSLDFDPTGHASALRLLSHDFH
jgi:error-prone DNA polymerase